MPPELAELCRVGEALGLDQPDLERILPRTFAALEAGWRNIRFVQSCYGTQADLTVTAELGPLVYRYSMGLYRGMSVADGAALLLDDLAHRPQEYVYPPLSEQWDRLMAIRELVGPRAILQTAPHPDHWTERVSRPAERLPLRGICCGQPMVELDTIGSVLRCQTCRRVANALDHAAEAEVARWLPEDGDAALEDRVQTLLDLARAGRKEDFTFLAGAVGVAPDDLEALWTGTVARLKRQTAGTT